MYHQFINVLLGHQCLRLVPLHRKQGSSNEDLTSNFFGKLKKIQVTNEIFHVIIHQIFPLVRNWSKDIT